MFTSRKMAIMVFGVLGFALCLSQVQAEVITIGITGEVTDGNVGLWGGGIHVGSIFTGTYSYDTSAPNLGQPPHWGGYSYNSPYGITIDLEGYEFKTDPTQSSGQYQVSVANDYDSGNGTKDSFAVWSYQNAPLNNGFTVYSIGWDLWDTTYNAISTIELPTTAPILSQWDYNRLSMSGATNQDRGFYIAGIVTQAYLVPEPLTSLLLITGVLFTGRWKRNSMNKPPQLPAATA